MDRVFRTWRCLFERAVSCCLLFGYAFPLWQISGGRYSHALPGLEAIGHAGLALAPKVHLTHCRLVVVCVPHHTLQDNFWATKMNLKVRHSTVHKCTQHNTQHSAQHSTQLRVGSACLVQ